MLSVPNISSFASNAGLSIKVRGRRAGGNTIAIIVDRISKALPAMPTNKEEIAIAKVIDIASRGEGEISII